jgi:(4S)-4-hydroxy-5-phosphonooxypentane-2,3-dione isomerase
MATRKIYMIAQIVYLTVEPENSEKLTREALANASASRLEPGVLRFDVLQNVDDPTRIVLYEVYASADALEAHRQTAHFKHWQEHGVPLLAKPRERAAYDVIDS